MEKNQGSYLKTYYMWIFLCVNMSKLAFTFDILLRENSEYLVFYWNLKTVWNIFF